MCLITLQQEPLIAKEDITVYKLIQSTLKPCFYVKTKDFKYEMNKLHETTIEESDDWFYFDDKDFDSILKYSSEKLEIEMSSNYTSFVKDKFKCFGQGFHAALTKERVISSHEAKFSYVICVECIIPKGSQYYTNLSGLVISDKILLIKTIED